MNTDFPILSFLLLPTVCVSWTSISLMQSIIAEQKTSKNHSEKMPSHSSSLKQLMMTPKKVLPEHNETFCDLSDFKCLITNHRERYIDKTLFIRELMTHFLNLHIVSRPRHFGKTLMLSTLQYFLDTRHANSSTIRAFKDLRIMNDINIVRQHMNRYRIIRLNFGYIKASSFRKNFRLLKREIAAAFRLHSDYLLNGMGSVVNLTVRPFYERILKEKASDEDLAQSIKFLAECIHQRSNSYSIILIDEYDTPIQTALERGHLTEMKKFMLAFYWFTLKSNKFYWKAVFTGRTHMHCGVLTGIMAIVSTVLGNTYQEFFGFTRSDLKELSERSGKGLQAVAYVEKHYDGYTFGRVDHIFNPRSVSNYLFGGCKVRWYAEDSQDAVEKFILGHGLYPVLTIQRMLTGELVWRNVLRQIFDVRTWDEEPAYWGYLLQLGYLSTTRREKGIRLLDPISNLTLRIPNLDIGSQLRVILYKRRPLSTRIPNYDQFVADLVTGRFSRAQKTIRRYVRKAGPFFNPHRKGFHPDVLADYVVMMLRGVERRYNSTMTLVRFPEKIISIEVRPRDTQHIPIRVVIERTSVLRTTWKKMQNVWCPFSGKPKTNETEILIAYNALFVQTCVRQALNASQSTQINAK